MPCRRPVLPGARAPAFTEARLGTRRGSEPVRLWDQLEEGLAYELPLHAICFGWPVSASIGEAFPPTILHSTSETAYGFNFDR